MIDRKNKYLSVRAQCSLLGLSRSSLYYQPTPFAEDTEIANRIAEIYEATPQYGYRRIHAQLTREGINVNRKKEHRLMNELGLKAIYPKPKTTIRSQQNKSYPYLLSGLTIERPHQVWQVDITYLRLPGGFVYLTALIDVYSRVVVGWRLSNSLFKEACLEALQDGIWRYGVPSIINSDQGAQFTSVEWERLCHLNEIKISMSHKGGSTDNAYIELFWRTLKFEGFYLAFPKTMGQLKSMLASFIHWYNEERLHSSLKYKTPMEVLKMVESQTYGYVDNPGELPTSPQAQQQPQLHYCLIN
ncbi:MAG: IS3 family transposase [Alphaproteobacteria bacterium]|nr:IS3 family transposase [Alphaproteobacteria bacterium]